MGLDPSPSNTDGQYGAGMAPFLTRSQGRDSGTGYFEAQDLNLNMNLTPIILSVNMNLLSFSRILTSQSQIL
jgi:hypothetical protein